MARYIDAEKLTAFLCQKRCGDDRAFCGDTTVCGLVLAVKDFPTADVAEVVRCKDCVHWKHRNYDDKHQCDVFDWLSTENDYCSFAERGEDAENHLQGSAK